MSEAREVSPVWRLRSRFPAGLARAAVETSDPLTATLIRSIRRYSEHQRAASDLFEQANNGISSSGFKFAKYQSYTRQAIGFYDVADRSDPRVSPLLYYYSFLNFVHALAILRNGDSPKEFSKLKSKAIGRHHGLRREVSDFPSIWESTISLTGFGAAHMFHAIVASSLKNGLRGGKEIFSKPTLPTSGKFKLRELCQYISDINHELELVLKSPSRYASCKISILKSGGDDGYYGYLAVTHCGPNCTQLDELDNRVYKILECSKLRKLEFPTENDLMNIFGFTKYRSEQYTFWQTGKRSSIEAVTECIATGLASHFVMIPVEGESIFYIELDCPIHNIKTDCPIDKEFGPFGHVRMSEIIAIYLLMFAMSIVVRYRAEEWEAILNTEVAWIIESFLKGAPLTFLRHYRNLLDGECWAITPR
jgi:YaaC-like Protein